MYVNIYTHMYVNMLSPGVFHILFPQNITNKYKYRKYVSVCMQTHFNMDNMNDLYLNTNYILISCNKNNIFRGNFNIRILVYPNILQYNTNTGI